MQIYFTASIVGKKQYITHYYAIINELIHQGHDVIADHIVKTTEEQIKMETSDERKQFHKTLENWILHADCIVVEASFPSISVGYEIALALNKGKAVLLLHTHGEPPSLLPELNTERLVIEKYNQESLPGIIQDFIRYTQSSNETRFTFFLTHDQSSYLTTASKKAGVPKSVYLRSLIEENRKKFD